MQTLLKKYITKVDCDDNSCSLRYYLKEGGLSLGVIRLRYHNMTGKISQRVITVVGMEIDRLIEDIMVSQHAPIEFGDVLVATIRKDAIDRIKENLGTENQTPNQS